MKRISVMRDRSGRSGRRRGSQNPGIATEPPPTAVGALAAAEGCARAGCGAEAKANPSAAHVIKAPTKRLFVQHFISMIVS
jgi:hypothetical protein